MAQPFDAARMTVGTAAPVATGVGLNPVTNQALFSASGSGAIVFYSGAAGQSELAWVDRSGVPIGAATQVGALTTIALSPDASQVVYDLSDARSAAFDLWRLIFSRGEPTRLTFNPGSDIFPVWSPGGTRLAYASVRDGPPQLHEIGAGGAGPDRHLLHTDLPAVPTGWTADASMLVYTLFNPKTAGGDIWLLPLGGSARPFLATAADERYGTLSNDGRWLAYVSNESGRYEVYVRSFPDAGNLRQLSSKGGLQPLWRADGREIFYLAPDRTLMAVDLGAAAGGFDPRPPRPLFATHAASLEIQPTARTYAAVRDGQRFLLANATQQARSEPIRVVLNWQAALRQ
jgi:eukaryotic-like serine/threonine-protein kinase